MKACRTEQSPASTTVILDRVEKISIGEHQATGRAIVSHFCGCYDIWKMQSCQTPPEDGSHNFTNGSPCGCLGHGHVCASSTHCTRLGGMGSSRERHTLEVQVAQGEAAELAIAAG
mmetsp:Transcript_74825/g.136745  ORF Transcript_74825/g.136745 Transcript_74825/m.136745 type:complete len:116 (-) Transcript_74825:549-896(-)